MVAYLYLTIIMVVCMITGLIVTIIEKKSLTPKPEKDIQSLQELQDALQDTTITDTKIAELEDDDEEYYDHPVLVSACTVNLEKVVHAIHKIDVEEEIEILDDPNVDCSFEEII